MEYHVLKMMLVNFEISENEVRKEFEKLNASKSAGPDNLSGRILKSCATQ